MLARQEFARVTHCKVQCLTARLHYSYPSDALNLKPSCYFTVKVKVIFSGNTVQNLHTIQRTEPKTGMQLSLSFHVLEKAERAACVFAVCAP